MIDVDDGGRYMCDQCIGDEELKEFIRDNAASHTCSFCGRTSETELIAADADSVAELVSRYVLSEYEDAAEHVPYESAEGGYQARTMSTHELLMELELYGDNDEAFEFLVESLPDYPWVEIDFWSLSPYQELTYGWEGFSEAVKHHTRYLFFPPRKKNEVWPGEGIRPEEMLAELGDVIRRADAVRRLKAGTIVYRIRAHKAGDSPSTLKDLGPPPPHAARYSNRMSPAGISMLYASEDEATALAESLPVHAGHTHITVARLRLLRDLRVVDLVSLPPVRAFTVEETRRERAQLSFAHSFAHEVSKKISKDGAEHIEYVPTQIVTEYLKFRFRDEKRRVRGLRYRSAQAEGGINLALFISDKDVSPPEWGERKAPLLELVSYEKRAL